MKNLLSKVSIILLVSSFFTAAEANTSYGIIAGMGRQHFEPSGGTIAQKFKPFGGLAVFFTKVEVDLLLKQNDFSYDSTDFSIRVPAFYRFGTGAFRPGLGAFVDYSLTEISEVSQLDWGLVASLQIHFAKVLFVDARYELGLADLNGAKSRNMMFALGYKF